MKLACVILAAGLGKRMNSSLPKVMHKIYDKPMIQYVLDSVSKLRPERTVIVVGEHHEEIEGSIRGSAVSFALQREAKGTGDALSKAKAALKDFDGTVLVLNGDTPLVTPETLKRFLRLHHKQRNAVSLISFIADDPKAYGRILRDSLGRISSIVEDRDATEGQKNIKEVNSGVYAIEQAALGLLKDIPLNPSKGEYYLTEVISIAKNRGYKVNSYCIGSENELMGVNTKSELLKAHLAMRKRIVNGWIEKGITFIDPDSAFVYPDVRIGGDTIIYPSVYLEGKTRVGKGCVIYPNVHIIDSEIGDGVLIKDSTVIEGAIVRSKAVIGPFAHLRHGCDIGSESKIGNFVEVKKSVIGQGTKASHLSYIGDALIGKGVNIGAGTITCNYDGKEKRRTTIDDNVFIGSDTQLVAPVRVGKGAYVGAGSTITKDVPPMSLALSRAEQKHIEGWALKKQFKVQSLKLKVKNRKDR